MTGAKRKRGGRGRGRSHDLKIKNLISKTSSSKLVLSRSSVVICIRLRTASNTSQLLWSKRIPAMTDGITYTVHAPMLTTHKLQTDTHTPIGQRDGTSYQTGEHALCYTNLPLRSRVSIGVDRSSRRWNTTSQHEAEWSCDLTCDLPPAALKALKLVLSWAVSTPSCMIRSYPWLFHWGLEA